MGRQVNNLRGADKPFAQRLRALLAGKEGNDAAYKEIPHGAPIALARIIGVNEKNISDYYYGNSFPELQTIMKIAQHYNVSMDYLLGLKDVRTTDIDEQKIYERIGLSDRSQQALSLSGKKTLDFLNRELEYVANIVERRRTFYKSTEYKMDDTLFGLLEDYVNGSREPGFIYMGGAPIPKDEIFRHLIERKIMKHLDDESKRIGTVQNTSLKTDAIEWIKKRYFDKMIHSREFNQIDFINALDEFCSDYKVKITLNYNELPLKEWTAEYDKIFNSAKVEFNAEDQKTILKEVESWHPQD